MSKISAGFKTRRKKNVMYFGNNTHKFILRKPSIQASDEFCVIDGKNKNSILYLYYTLEYYHNDVSYDNDGNQKNKWIKKWERFVGDFPSIQAVPSCLDELKNINLEEKGQQTKYRSGEIGYSYTITIDGGFMGEDFYEITKCKDPNHYGIYYVLSIGQGHDAGPCQDFNIVRISWLKGRDMKEFKKFAQGIIDIAIEKHNTFIKKDYYEFQNKVELRENSIILYKNENCVGLPLSDETIEDIYQIGENLSIYLYNNFELNKNHYYTLKKIDVKNKKIIVMANEELTFSISEVSYIYDNENYNIHKQKVEEYICQH